MNVKLVRPAGDMMGLHGEFLPASKRYINDYIQYVKSDFLAGLGFGATRCWEKIQEFISDILWIQEEMFTCNRPLPVKGKRYGHKCVSVCFVGSLGGGKSFCNNLLVYYSVCSGDRQLSLTPKVNVATGKQTYRRLQRKSTL